MKWRRLIGNERRLDEVDDLIDSLMVHDAGDDLLIR
jgi:hypothetical protein